MKYNTGIWLWGIWLRDCISVFMRGVWDALDVRRLYFFLRRSDVIRVKFVNAVACHIILAILVIFFDEFLLKWIETWKSTWSTTIWWIIFVTQRLVFSIAYVIVLVISALWGDDMCKHAFYLTKSYISRPSNFEIVSQPAFDALSGEILWTIATRVWALPIFLQFFIPTSLAIPAQIVHCAWVISIYSFEVRWMLLRWPCELRCVYFEERSLYFLGFGLPLSLAIVGAANSSTLASNCVFGAGLTISLVLAFCANPVPVMSRPFISSSREKASLSNTYNKMGFDQPIEAETDLIRTTRLPLFGALLWQLRGVLQLVTETFSTKGGSKGGERSILVENRFRKAMEVFEQKLGAEQNVT